MSPGGVTSPEPPDFATEVVGPHVDAGAEVVDVAATAVEVAVEPGGAARLDVLLPEHAPARTAAETAPRSRRTRITARTVSAPSGRQLHLWRGGRGGRPPQSSLVSGRPSAVAETHPLGIRAHCDVGAPVMGSARTIRVALLAPPRDRLWIARSGRVPIPGERPD